jgi:hypothetical protein
MACRDLDGTLAYVPSQWDFPQVDDAQLGLGQLRVGTWGGFVFVNPDPACEELETFLGDLEHFADWTLDDRFIEGHVAKLYAANWKVAQEAFMETFHVGSTHPQMLVRMGDVNGQYDCYEHCSRSMNASGVASPILRWQPSQQDMLDAMLDRRLDEPSQVEIPDGMTFRAFSGQLSRESLRPIVGDRRGVLDRRQGARLDRAHPRQDSFNIPKVQIGLRSAPADGLPLSLYQESKVRHFHHLLDRWLQIETPGATR